MNFYPNDLDPSKVKYCRRVAKRTGPNYYFATRYYPKEIRKATWCFYAFVRESDQIVDGNLYSTNQEKINALGAWAENWDNAYNQGKSPHISQLAAAEVLKKYNVPYELTHDFLASMADDINTDRYQSYEDLRQYMYGSASVIGIIMSYIIGFKGGQETLKKAGMLGEAMQMANFIRDVGEDYRDLQRIYLPQEDLVRFGVTELDISTGRITNNFKELIKFEISRTRQLYADSLPYIENLLPAGQFPVVLASQIYLEILCRIEESGYEVLSEKKQQPNLLGKAKIEFDLRFGARKNNHFDITCAL